MLVPVHPTDATADPLVLFTEETFDRHDAEVAYPALKISPQLCVPLCHRHAAIATRDFLHPILELGDIQDKLSANTYPAIIAAIVLDIFINPSSSAPTTPATTAPMS